MMLFNFDALTPLQNFLLSIGFIIAFLVGLVMGLAGVEFKWEKKIKPYLLWLGIVLIAGNAIYWLIN